MTLSANDFELLLQANRILSSKLNVDEVLQAVLELATKVVHAEAASLLLLDEKTDELYFDVALGSVKEQVKQIRIKVGEGIAGWVAKNVRPLIVNDVRKDPRFTAKVDKSTSFVTRSILAVPLKAKGRLIGVVEAINKENEMPFTPQDQEAFGVFASQAAIAIENARLFSAVTRERNKLDTVFTEMSDGVLVLDDKARIAILNQAARQFLGMNDEDGVGRAFDQALFPGFEPCAALNKFAESSAQTMKIDLVRRQGKDLYLSAHVHRLKANERNAEDGWLVLLRDVTEQMKGETLKRDFLSLISHKLKTPLTVIVGYAPALLAKADGLSDFQKKAVQSICTQGEQLSQLVEKLLRFTIVESSNLKRKTEPTALSQVVDNAVTSLKYFIEDRHAIVKVAPEIGQLPKVLVDSVLSIEVFKNLIENAIKFNDKPAPEVVISAKKNGTGVAIFVKDNGLGIPPEETEKVFEKFYQIENSFTGQVPGAGLGLALCKKVVEEMGGNIRLESQLQSGTTAIVTLPTK